MDPLLAFKDALLAQNVATKFAAKDQVFVDGSGNPTGPSTPWGKADHVKDIIRGVRWVGTPSHGGLGVAKSIADKMLSSAARRLGNYQGGYYWYEEDVQCAIPFYEHPEWAAASGLSSPSKDKFEADIKRSYPKYFDMLNDGSKEPEKLKPGMEIKFLKPAKFGSGWSFNEGDVVTVEKTTSSSIVFKAKGGMGQSVSFKCPMGWYYGFGYSSERYLEAV